MSGRPEKFPRRQDTEYEVDELPEDETAEHIPLLELDPNNPSTSPGRPLSPTVLITSHPQINNPTDSSDCSTVPTTSKDSEYDVSTEMTDLSSTEKSAEANVTIEIATNLEPCPTEPARDSITEPSPVAPCTCMCCFCWKNCKKIVNKKKEQAEKDKQEDEQKDDDKKL